MIQLQEKQKALSRGGCGCFVPLNSVFFPDKMNPSLALSGQLENDEEVSVLCGGQ